MKRPALSTARPVKSGEVLPAPNAGAAGSRIPNRPQRNKKILSLILQSAFTLPLDRVLFEIHLWRLLGHPGYFEVIPRRSLPKMPGQERARGTA